MPGVTVVVPNWNRRELLARLLARLHTQTISIDEVIVVDNGSRDGSVDLARSEGARVIALPENMGFAAAVNRGLKESRTELVAVVNNDVEPERDWLERLARAVARRRIWFATGKLMDPKRPGALDGAYDLVCRGACAWHAGQGRQDGPVWSRTRRIRSAPFAAAVFRAELFDKVGLLDEEFGSYLEDVDFGLRCAERGFAGVYVPSAVAHHLGSATLGAWNKEIVRRIARNQVLLVARHFRGRALWRHGWAILVAQSLWGLLALRHGRPLAFARGKLEGLARFLEYRRRHSGNCIGERRVERILDSGDSEILRLQRLAGFDTYWRWYFALTRLT